MGVISDHLRNGVLSARQLMGVLQVSPATLSRRLREEVDTVIRIGKGPATRYGLVQTWANSATARFPLTRIDEQGAATFAGELVTLTSRQTAWLPAGEVFDGLPVEISDVCPSGFLGQLFARQHADIGLPPRISDWSDHHILLAVSRRGEDLPGNLIVGRESLDRWYNSRPTMMTPEK